MLNQLTAVRLRDQLASLDVFVANKTAEEWNREPSTGKWSARENLAHLGRYHEVFLERIRRILSEDHPTLTRYRAEDDREWPRWVTLSTDDLLGRIGTLRRELTALTNGLSDFEQYRNGNHPLFGDLTVRRWIEFFLLHEAHHLYTMMNRLGEAALHLAAESGRAPSASR